LGFEGGFVGFAGPGEAEGVVVVWVLVVVWVAVNGVLAESYAAAVGEVDFVVECDPFGGGDLCGRWEEVVI